MLVASSKLHEGFNHMIIHHEPLQGCHFRDRIHELEEGNDFLAARSLDEYLGHGVVLEAWDYEALTQIPQVSQLEQGDGDVCRVLNILGVEPVDEEAEDEGINIIEGHCEGFTFLERVAEGGFEEGRVVGDQVQVDREGLLP